MSIINEALKKAQVKFQNVKKDNTVPPSPPQSPVFKIADDQPSVTNLQHEENPYLQYVKADQTPGAADTPGSPNPAFSPSIKKSAAAKKERKVFQTPRLIYLILLLCGLIAVSFTIYHPLIERSLNNGALKFPSLTMPNKKPKARTHESGVINISGVMMKGNSKLVIINDEVYQKGSVINSMTIIDINEDRIIMQDSTGVQKEFTVR